MALTVGDLVDLLQELPRETLVVMSSDAEGNTYSPLSEVGTATYVPESTWHGYLWQPEDYIDESEYDEDDEEWDVEPEVFEEDEPENAVDCVVLIPVN